MSLPPQGGWPQQPPGPPPSQGHPYGPPPGYNPQQAPPPGFQQGGWGPQPGPPPPKGSNLKWLLVAVAVLLVIGISVGATLIFTRGESGGGATTPTSGAPSDVASANDTGPVSIITDEPTCAAYININNGIASVEGKGWSDQRGGFGPEETLTAEQRSELAAVATVIRNAADQMTQLVRQTPHRVVRELYEQFIAYGRAYAESIATYTPADNFLADANVSFGNALTGICNVIRYGSVSRALTLGPAQSPSQPASPVNAENPQPFINSASPACASWVAMETDFLSATAAWQALDTNVPGPQWSPEQRSIQLSTLPRLTELASGMESKGRQSDNAVFDDFAALGALYFRAYASSGEDYEGADSWLSYTGLRLSNAISGACQAAG